MRPGKGFFVFPDGFHGAEERKSTEKVQCREEFLVRKSVRKDGRAIDEIGSCAYDRASYRLHRIILYMYASIRWNPGLGYR